MRINKYIAHSGLCSRRKADRLVEAGRVSVNGKVIDQPGFKVQKGDEVKVDGRSLDIKEKFYIKLYKPVGFITSNFDPYNEKDLNDLIDIGERFFAAGRLDKDSEGLLIITNDGEFTNKLTHPSQEISKEYIVIADKALNEKQKQEFEKGIDIGNGEVTSNSKIYELNNFTYKVIIHQGYNRQIRRMFDYFGLRVKSLKRVRIGDIKLMGLKEKEYRYFNDSEMEFVKKVLR